MYLQETNLKVLELLERFKYLTNSQLIKLGIASSQPGMARILQRFFKHKQELIKSPLVKKLTFKPDPVRGKLENSYMLSAKGAKYLSEYIGVDISEIDYIKGNGYFRDYQHRKSQIDYHIDLYLDSIQNGYSLDFFHSYFDKTGSNNSSKNKMLEAKTKLYYSDGSWYIPDGIYKLTKTISDGSLHSFYYILEIHKNNDTKRAIETIKKNIQALADGSIYKKYDYQCSPTIVMVFDDEKIKENVLKRLDKIKDFEEFKEFFNFQ